MAVPMAATPSEPARHHPALLDRLDPDLLHPARLAGPHAWHAWGLTRHAPTDTTIRLVVAPGPDAATQIRRITDSLHDQLTGPTWPPAPPLDIRRDNSRLTCQANATPISTISVDTATWDRGGLTTACGAHYTRDGWPTLDQHAALTDRIHAIDAAHPPVSDLGDLANWVEHLMAGQQVAARTNPISTLLERQQTHAPRSIHRLATILDSAREHGMTQPALTYLGATLPGARRRPQTQRRR